MLNQQSLIEYAHKRKRRRESTTLNEIRAQIERLGFSQSELARRAGMHPSTVNLIVRGRMVPYESQLAKIAAALGWTGDPTDLLDEVDDGSA